ncbi:MAG: hypothetical protein IKG82_00170, partial [Oscillospiraceae bacterium]|nr:hypothetical protein [Oscillospiraceae bacterium]
MKKQMMLLTAAMIGVLFTGCGSDPVQINVNIPADTVTTAAAETTAAETAAVTTVTEAAVTAAADTAAAQTAPEQTAAAPAATTAAPAAECPYSADDLVGEWSLPGTFGNRNNTLTVRKDGSVIMRYAAGGTRFGKVRIDPEEHPDGSVSYWYAFC